MLLFIHGVTVLYFFGWIYEILYDRKTIPFLLNVILAEVYPNYQSQVEMKKGYLALSSRLLMLEVQGL